MLDFTSVLYLGLWHPSRSLRPWNRFATGSPAVLVAPPGAAQVASRLATLQGCEWAVLAPSTLHLFWDLLALWAKEQVAIYLDAGAYPIARWGVERAAALGIPVYSFPHYDAIGLQSILQRNEHLRLRPLVVADGLCPFSGRSAPVLAYLEIIRGYDGYLILDDTQALGILGYAPEPRIPYGHGGGGVLRWHNLRSPDVLVVSSLAKGFGVPVAALSGSRAMVKRFEEKSETRVHCSPASVAVVHAAEHALAINAKHGDTLRLRLANRVQRFRTHIAALGHRAEGGLFPVQTLQTAGRPRGFDAARLHQQLLKAGVKTVLHRARRGSPVRISFIITSRHTAVDIEVAVRTLDSVTRGSVAYNMIGCESWIGHSTMSQVPPAKPEA